MPKTKILIQQYIENYKTKSENEEIYAILIPVMLPTSSQSSVHQT